MDHGVLNRHGGLPANAAVVIVVVATVEDQGSAVLAGLDQALELAVTGVIAAHEADLYQVLSAGDFRLYDLLAELGSGGQGLLTEDGLAGLDRLKDEGSVPGICCCDDDSLDLSVMDQLFGCVKCADPEFVCNRLSEILVHIRTGDDSSALQTGVDALDVCSADRAGSYQTNL